MPETETAPKAEETETPKAEEPKAEAPEAPKEEPWDPDRAKKTIEAQRESEKNLKAKLKEAQAKAAKLDEIEAANLSEQEKLAKRLEEAEAKVADADKRLRRSNLIAELTQPGIVNARAAAKLIEGVEYDDDGNPTNLGAADDPQSLLGKFLEENDYLRGSGKPKPPSTDAREGDDTTPPSLTAEEAAMAESMGMTPEEYAANK